MMLINDGYLDIEQDWGVPPIKIEGGSGAIEEDWGILGVGGGGSNVHGSGCGLSPYWDV